MSARYRLGRPCPHCRAVLVDGNTARVTAGDQVRCVALARETSAAHAELSAVGAARVRPGPPPPPRSSRRATPASGRPPW